MIWFTIMMALHTFDGQYSRMTWARWYQNVKLFWTWLIIGPRSRSDGSKVSISVPVYFYSVITNHTLLTFTIMARSYPADRSA